MKDTIVFIPKKKKETFPIIFTQDEDSEEFKEALIKYVAKDVTRIKLPCCQRELYRRLDKISNKSGFRRNFSFRYSITEEEFKMIMEE